MEYLLCPGGSRGRSAHAPNRRIVKRKATEARLTGQDVQVEEAPACFVCEKHRLGDDAPGGILFRDDLVYAGHAFDPAGATSAYRGYLMVEPLRHVAGLGGLTDDEAMRLGWLVNRLSGLQRAVLGADHVYAFVFGGAPPSRRTPDHLHVHLAPRYPETPPEFRGPTVTRWPDAPRVDADQMRALVARLRSEAQPALGTGREPTAE